MEVRVMEVMDLEEQVTEVEEVGVAAAEEQVTEEQVTVVVVVVVVEEKETVAIMPEAVIALAGSMGRLHKRCSNTTRHT